MDSWYHLSDYVNQESETAFELLVREHLNMVYGTALRCTGTREGAEEISQETFLLLAHKARQLTPKGSLGAWLHGVTVLKSKAWMRRERKRRGREIPLMEDLLAVQPSRSESDRIQGLDEAVAALDEQDRTLVHLRFFKKLSLREVGHSLGLSEDAARKRVSRMLQRLRERYLREGKKVSSSAITGALTDLGGQAAPYTLMESMMSVMPASTLPSSFTVSKFIAIFSFMKTKSIILSGIILLLAGLFLGKWVNHQQSKQSEPELAGVETSVNPPTPDSASPLSIASTDRASKGGERLLPDPANVGLRNRFKALLESAKATDVGEKDPAYLFLEEMQVAERGQVWDLVRDALDATLPVVRLRATRLLPLLWPQYKEALPLLYQRLGEESELSPELAGQTVITLTQLIDQPHELLSVVQSAMKGNADVKASLALQAPLLTSAFRDRLTEWIPQVESYLDDSDPSKQLLAARILAQSDHAVSEKTLDLLIRSLTPDKQPDDPQAVSILGLIWKLGPQASSVSDQLIALADANPAWGDRVDAVLKSILPAELAGFGVPTPLPALSPDEETALQTLQQDPQRRNAWLNDLSADVYSEKDLLILAGLGDQATEAVPQLEKALETALRTGELQQAMLLGGALERIQPELPKPLITGMDLVPVIQSLKLPIGNTERMAAMGMAMSKWTQSMLSQMTLRRDDIPTYADQLRAIHPDLYAQFVREMLKQDRRWKRTLSPSVD